MCTYITVHIVYFKELRTDEPTFQISLFLPVLSSFIVGSLRLDTLGMNRGDQPVLNRR